MTKRFYDMDNALGYLTISSTRLMSAYFRKRLLESGTDLTPEQWGVLVQLWNSQGEGPDWGITQDALAYTLCVDKSSLSRVLDVMERKGLIRRTRDFDDARRKILQTTPTADSMKAHCRDIADASSANMLEGVAGEDLEACIRVLSKVKDTIRKLS